MAEANAPAESISPEMMENIMDKIEDFYFGEGETGGEAIFGKFAEQHHHHFDEDCDAEENENKLV